ncbi:hypothetical protein I5M27_11080 [Adhaeribacter sp. BT258]|uniref:Glycosyltransferase RgtA/B/C/D-like domain-containing protein n=1 Tax=Adhaeribacter terrigena TaxID=2793070 RepID=A0ABS1C2A7_9BACT|nr:hypothetical protein [Adhaeribacter terrigena]MBK0403531.1 hypothetical protein [Adhaeribacter terrigena]
MSVNPGRVQKEYWLVFAFSAAIVFGNAYLILVNHDAAFSSDEASYLALGSGNWDVNITHRYRVIIPFLARGLAEILSLLSGKSGTLPLGFSFFVVNSTLMALAGTVLYSLAKTVGAGVAGRFIAVLAVLSSGYCSYLAGIALVDSLYFLALALLFYSLVSQNEAALFGCLILGPLAKESFWLFVPLTLIFGRFIPLHRLVFYLVLAGCIFIANNSLVDSLSGLPVPARAANAFEHLHNAGRTFRKFFSLSGFMSWFSAFGIFNFLVLAGLLSRKLRLKPGARLTQMQVLFLLIVAAHVLLSGDIGRMWYLAAPVFAVAVALTTDRLLAPFFRREQISLNEPELAEQQSK